MKKPGTAALLLVLLLVTTFISGVYADDGHGNIIVVSMGDSYSSGEGIEPFYGQYSGSEEKTRNPDWLAHRSMLSWPGRLVFPELGVPLKNVPRGSYNNGVFTPGTWFFVASSGASTDHLTAPQDKKVKRTSAFHSELQKLDAQCGVLYELRARGMYADYITITIGGNDLDFAGIIVSAVLGGDQYGVVYLLPSALDKAWKKYYEGGAREKIRQAYRTIWSANGGKGTILVAGYPRLLDEEGRGLPFSQDEAKIMNEAVSKFNSDLELLVEECRSEGMDIWFIPVEQEFGNKGAYAENALINPVIFGAQNEDLNLYSPVCSYSMHPYEAGAAAYARCVQGFIDESLSGGLRRDIRSSGDPVDPADSLTRLDLDIGFEDNSALSTYDVRMYFDGQYLASLDHGKGYQGTMEVKPGIHTISFQEVGKSAVCGSSTFGVNGPVRFSCAIHARKNEIEITGERTISIRSDDPFPGMFRVNGDLVLEMNISFKRNVASSKYDVELYVDGTFVTTLPHGNDFTGRIGVSKGNHVIMFCMAGDKSIRGTSQISVSSTNSTFSCNIEAKKDQVKVTKEKIK